MKNHFLAPSLGRSFVLISVTLLALCVSLLLAHTSRAAADGVPCHTINSTGSGILERYAYPFTFFTTQPHLALSVNCRSDGTGSMTAGVDYYGDWYTDSDQQPYMLIYKYGYHYVNGKWQRVSFTGNNPLGNWYLGSATAQLRDMGTSGKVLAYMCENVSGEWRCGCKDGTCASPRWQYQTYNKNGISFEDTPQKLNTDPRASSAVIIPEGQFALPGQRITVHMYGMPVTNANSVLIDRAGEEYSVTVSGRDEANSTLQVTIGSDILPGMYRLQMQDTAGEQVAKFEGFFVGYRDARSPKVTSHSVSRDSATGLTTLTLRGEGFDALENKVIVYEKAHVPLESKDGRTLSVLLPEGHVQSVESSYRNDPDLVKKLKLIVMVMNVNGVSEPYYLQGNYLESVMSE